jgi:hypothetical protein
MAPQQPAFPAFGDAAAFPSGLQPPPPLPGVMRVDLLGSGLRVDSPGSVRSSATAMDLGGLPPLPGSVLDEALNLLSFDSAQVGGWLCASGQWWCSGLWSTAELSV